MTGASAKIREEIRKILVVAVFFSTGFCLILIAERLFTGTGAETGRFVRAIVGGLIVAKILLLVDLLPLIHAFPHKPLVHNIVWKSSLYIAASVLFQYIDPFVKNLFRGKGVSMSSSLALQELARPRTWAIEIWLAMLLVAFVTMRELSRVIGKEEMEQIFFGFAVKPGGETRPRRAA